MVSRSSYNTPRLESRKLRAIKRTTPWIRCFIWILGALSVAEPFFVASKRAAGKFVFPLDDAYIYLRYALSYFSEGPYVLPGTEGLTSGSTSLAYPLLPGTIHLLGVDRLALPTAVFWLSAVFLGICAHLAYELVRIIVDSPTILPHPHKATNSAPSQSLILGTWPPKWPLGQTLFGTLWGNVAGLLAGLTLITSPYVVWGLLVGMEGGLYVSVLLGTLCLWIRKSTVQPEIITRPNENPTNWKTHLSLKGIPGTHLFSKVLLLALMALLPLTRPEGALVVGSLVFIGILMAPEKTRISAAFWFPMTLLPWIVYLVAHRISVGYFAPNTAVAKSLLNEPYLDFSRYLEMTKQNLTGILQRLRGDPKHGDPMLSWPAMTFGLALVAVAMGLRDSLTPALKSTLNWIQNRISSQESSSRLKRSERLASPNASLLRSPWVPLSLAVVVTLGGLSQNRVLFFDNHRYSLGLLVLVVVASSSVFATITQKLKIPLLLLFAAYFSMDSNTKPLKKMELVYGAHAQDIARFQIAIGQFGAQHLPQKALLGINDAGAIPYYAQRRSLDFVGLTTNGFAKAFRHGNGSLFEALENLSPSKRPTHFAIFRRYLRSTGILGKCLFRPKTGRKTGSRANVNALYLANWKHMGKEHEIPYKARSSESSTALSYKIVDRMDVADLISEKKHSYENPRPDLKWYAWRVNYSLSRYEKNSKSGPSPHGTPIADGGRPITTHEQMEMKLCSKGRRCFWVARLAAYRRTQLVLFLNGEMLGELEIPRTQRFRIVTMEIPQKFKDTKASQLRIAVRTPTLRRGRLQWAPSYVSYQHWIIAENRKARANTQLLQAVSHFQTLMPTIPTHIISINNQIPRQSVPLGLPMEHPPEGR